jgi:hypothetical protein
MMLRQEFPRQMKSTLGFGMAPNFPENFSFFRKGCPGSSSTMACMVSGLVMLHPPFFPPLYRSCGSRQSLTNHKDF